MCMAVWRVRGYCTVTTITSSYNKITCITKVLYRSHHLVFTNTITHSSTDKKAWFFSGSRAFFRHDRLWCFFLYKLNMSMSVFKAMCVEYIHWRGDFFFNVQTMRGLISSEKPQPSDMCSWSPKIIFSYIYIRIVLHISSILFNTFWSILVISGDRLVLIPPVLRKWNREESCIDKVTWWY